MPDVPPLLMLPALSVELPVPPDDMPLPPPEVVPLPLLDDMPPLLPDDMPPLLPDDESDEPLPLDIEPEDLLVSPEEAPLEPPLMPLELAPDEPMLPALGEDPEVDGLLELLCASAIEDTDAITTNDNDRRVDFMVMAHSWSWKKSIIDAAAWTQRSRLLFSTGCAAPMEFAPQPWQVVEFTRFFTM